MSEQRYPVVLCDGDDGMCEEFELDHTLHGLGRLVGSETQLPPGWSGARPGTGGEHYCPRCTEDRAEPPTYPRDDYADTLAAEDAARAEERRES